MAEFEFFRLSLSVPTLGPLLEGEDRQEPSLSRQEFLSTIFSIRRDFPHRGRMYVYAPTPKDAHQDNKIGGIIGKQVEQVVNSGPESLFAPEILSHWRIAYLGIDLKSDRQIVAFEVKNEIGSGTSLVQSLVESYVASDRSKIHWHVDINPIVEESEFWEAVKELKGTIKELTFNFVPPNGITGFESFKEFDKLAKRQANASSSAYTLKNEDAALMPSGETVESAAEYTSEGGGEIIIRGERRKILYRSGSRKRLKAIPESLMPRLGEIAKMLGLLDLLFPNSSKDTKDGDD